MHIVHVATEVAPVARAGGLADVILGLSRELMHQGHQVTVILPKYACLEEQYIDNLCLLNEEVSSFWKGKECLNKIWIGSIGGIRTIFIDPHEGFFQRNMIYGYPDDCDRFLYFARAAIDFIIKKNLDPDVIHLHEWHTAAIAPLVKTIYQHQVSSKIVLTMHNLEYQGICDASHLSEIGLDITCHDNTDPHLTNILKLGILYADALNTVSPTYSRQVLTEQHGFALNETLLEHRYKFQGILNGLDYNYWNPSADLFLPFQYTFDQQLFEKKQYAKSILRKRIGLEDDQKPLIGCISRLVPQKGLDFIKHALKFSLEHEAQFVLLGSTPILQIHEEFTQLKKKHQNNANTQLILEHHEELVHLIFSAADMMVVPSLFEPCGLTQLIALRYGCVPIVHKTGGLADTVHDVDHSGKPFVETNGYCFDSPDFDKFEKTLMRALYCKRKNPLKWQQLVRNGMQQDFSWKRSVEDYLNLYDTVAKPRNFVSS